MITKGYPYFRKPQNHHPFLDGIFPNKNHPAIGVPPWKPPCGEHRMAAGNLCRSSSASEVRRAEDPSCASERRSRWIPPVVLILCALLDHGGAKKGRNCLFIYIYTHIWNYLYIYIICIYTYIIYICLSFWGVCLGEKKTWTWESCNTGLYPQMCRSTNRASRAVSLIQCKVCTLVLVWFVCNLCKDMYLKS